MNHITELRKKAGYKTLTSCAKDLDITITMLSEVENNNRIPSPYLARRMVEKFNCTFDDIFLPYKFTRSKYRQKIS